MKKQDEVDLMRLLHGELPAPQAASLRARLEEEPELAAAYRHLAETWEGLVLPATREVPPGFVGRVLAHLPRERHGGLHWSTAPVWARAAAAAALLGGILLGVGLAQPRGEATWEAYLEPEPSLAESYWLLFADSEEDPSPSDEVVP